MKAKTKEEVIQDIKNKNDEYLTTVYAIIFFLNTYRFELNKEGEELVVFQGRKLFSDLEKKTFVTPDLGIVISDKVGLLGEVKYSFPSNQEHWSSIFNQIKKYDSIVNGWPSKEDKVDSYDIVLLVHQSRSRKVVDYYLNSLSDDEKLTKSFAIIEFNRSSQGKEYFHFRIEHGKLSQSTLNSKMYDGVQIPFESCLSEYSKIKYVMSNLICHSYCI